MQDKRSDAITTALLLPALLVATKGVFPLVLRAGLPVAVAALAAGGTAGVIALAPSAFGGRVRWLLIVAVAATGAALSIALHALS